MCTFVILRRPGHPWPVIVGANRDEMRDRPASPPGRHWPDRPEVVAGMDELAGGSWLGVNDYGLLAAVMNREGALGPAAERRTRGELVLEALDHAEASQAAAALAELEGSAYRAFNLVVADPRDAFWIRHSGAVDAPLAVAPIPEGLSVLTAGDLNDAALPRVRTFLPRFREAPAPRPEAGEWSAWAGLLASRVHDADAGPEGAMAVVRDDGFATVSSALVALPAYPGPSARPVWLHAEGPPDPEGYEAVDMAPIEPL